jgi:hypothetical protein
LRVGPTMNRDVRGLPRFGTPGTIETPDVFEIPAPDGYRCLVVYDEHGKEFGRVQLREHAMDDVLIADRLQRLRDMHHPAKPHLRLEKP